jgi:hypothetical protein
MKFTSDEVNFINNIIAQAYGGDRRKVTIEFLIGRWQNFIEELEKGYEDTIYEYRDELVKRDILARILNASSPSLKTKLSSTLDPLDIRFDNLTVSIQKPLLDGMEQDHTWWYKVPKKANDEFMEYLRHEKYID